MSEAWVQHNLYCPCCLSESLSKFSNNNPIGDFFCKKCTEQFELKSQFGQIRQKVVDGAYNKMIERISSSQNPNLLLLNYDSQYSVNDLLLVPKHFFIPDIIEKRKPLSKEAKRSGWIGCNILLSKLPVLGRISIIKNSAIIEKEFVREKWLSAFKLRDELNISKGWIFEILNIVENLEDEIFSLEEVYNFSFLLNEKFPKNNNIKPKIRQQLQKLRDFGYIEFLGNGKYQRLNYTSINGLRC